MATEIVVESPTGDRALVHPDALHDWVLRGFTAIGPASERRDPILTDPEWAAEVQRRDEAIQAALNTTPRKATRKVTTHA